MFTADTFNSKNMFIMYLYANFIFLVFAITTKQLYEHDFIVEHEQDDTKETVIVSNCKDQHNENFLNLICYGNMIIYSVFLLFLIISLIKIGKLFNNVFIIIY